MFCLCSLFLTCDCNSEIIEINDTLLIKKGQVKSLRDLEEVLLVDVVASPKRNVFGKCLTASYCSQDVH